MGALETGTASPEGARWPRFPHLCVMTLTPPLRACLLCPEMGQSRPGQPLSPLASDDPAPSLPPCPWRKHQRPHQPCWLPPATQLGGF